MALTYDLGTINDRLARDPEDFVAECDAAYRHKVIEAADLVQKNMATSPIVLLSGPSGSGKTTTALKLERELLERGVSCTTISLDRYFKTFDPKTVPRTPDGMLDLESPKCLDMELLDEHFTMLNERKEILVPYFMFTQQRRSATRFTPVCPKENEVVIFEGIHALNDDIAGRHPEAFKLYVSARSDIVDGDETVFKGTWMRLVRRVVRDDNFRGSDAAFTLALWANVRRGEKLYISPYKDRADYRFDSSLPYEVSLMKQFAAPLFAGLSPDVERGEELADIVPALDRFADLSADLVSPDSLMREFIGGGSYKY
ncbi:MAG: adenylyl-sulfate kinase [Oscillospiraceae bacterium]|nr:adenylyl-sulfate kinase [Oscillospiraceae bacterium]